MGPTFDRLGMKASHALAPAISHGRAWRPINYKPLLRAEGRARRPLPPSAVLMMPRITTREGGKEGRGRLCNIRERRKG